MEDWRRRMTFCGLPVPGGRRNYCRSVWCCRCSRWRAARLAEGAAAVAAWDGAEQSLLQAEMSFPAGGLETFQRARQAVRNLLDRQAAHDGRWNAVCVWLVLSASGTASGLVWSAGFGRCRIETVLSRVAITRVEGWPGSVDADAVAMQVRHSVLTASSGGDDAYRERVATRGGYKAISFRRGW